MDDPSKPMQQQSVEPISVQKCLEGLVKLQARIRGCLVRMRLGSLLKKSKPLLKMPTAKQLDYSNDASSQALSKVSARKFDLASRDWRAYFKEEELETAFQAVEIEKRDIPEENSSDAGSASDPSLDNFDPDEICNKVYNLPESLASKLIQQNHHLRHSLQTQLANQTPVSASQLYQRIKGIEPQSLQNLRRVSSKLD